MQNETNDLFSSCLFLQIIVWREEYNRMSGSPDYEWSVTHDEASDWTLVSYQVSWKRLIHCVKYDQSLFTIVQTISCIYVYIDLLACTISSISHAKHLYLQICIKQVQTVRWRHNISSNSLNRLVYIFIPMNRYFLYYAAQKSLGGDKKFQLCLIENCTEKAICKCGLVSAVLKLEKCQRL